MTATYKGIIAVCKRCGEAGVCWHGVCFKCQREDDKEKERRLAYDAETDTIPKTKEIPTN